MMRGMLSTAVMSRPFRTPIRSISSCDFPSGLCACASSRLAAATPSWSKMKNFESGPWSTFISCIPSRIESITDCAIADAYVSSMERFRLLSAVLKTASIGRRPIMRIVMEIRISMSVKPLWRGLARISGPRRRLLSAQVLEPRADVEDARRRAPRAEVQVDQAAAGLPLRLHLGAVRRGLDDHEVRPLRVRDLVIALVGLEEVPAAGLVGRVVDPLLDRPVRAER